MVVVCEALGKVEWQWWLWVRWLWVVRGGGFKGIQQGMYKGVMGFWLLGFYSLVEDNLGS